MAEIISVAVQQFTVCPLEALEVYWSIFDRPSQRFADQISSLQVSIRFDLMSRAVEAHGF